MGVDSEEVHLLGLSQRLHCRSQNLHQLQRLETWTNDLRGKFSSSHFAAPKNRGSVRKAGVHIQKGVCTTFSLRLVLCVRSGPGAHCYQETSGDTATNVRGLRLWWVRRELLGNEVSPKNAPRPKPLKHFFSGSTKPPKVLNQKPFMWWSHFNKSLPCSCGTTALHSLFLLRCGSKKYKALMGVLGHRVFSRASRKPGLNKRVPVPGQVSIMASLLGDPTWHLKGSDPWKILGC